MGRTKRFISGVSLGYLSRLAVMLAGLWLTPFLLGRIGPHDYGLWLVALQVLAYVVLLDVGVVALLPRETAFATGRMRRTGDGAELPRLVGETARLVLCLNVVIAGTSLAGPSFNTQLGVQFWFLAAALHGAGLGAGRRRPGAREADGPH